MKVALDLVWLTEEGGGVGRYAEELVAALVEHEPSLELTGILGARAPERMAAVPGVRWVRAPADPQDPRHLAEVLLAQPLRARRRGTDVVHHLSGIGAPAHPGVASVVTLHDLLWLHLPEQWGTLRAARTTRTLSLLAARGADRVITPSAFTRDDVVRHTRVPAERIDVVHHGVHVRRPTRNVPTEAELRRTHDLGDRPVVLCVAQKRPYKRQEVLVRALPDLPGTVLVLPGAPTPYEDELRALAASLGVADRVRLPRWVSDAELEGLYALTACFALPSLLEGFGMPILEAMARGVPVACADRGSLPEVAGDAAVLFDPEEQASVTAALARVLHDPGDLAERGRVRAAGFTWRRAAEETATAYRRAAATRSSAASTTPAPAAHENPLA